MGGKEYLEDIHLSEQEKGFSTLVDIKDEQPSNDSTESRELVT